MLGASRCLVGRRRRIVARLRGCKLLKTKNFPNNDIIPHSTKNVKVVFRFGEILILLMYIYKKIYINK